MTFATLCLLLVPLQYSFEPGTKIQYDSTITFEGFIPILGGYEGTVVVKMGVDVDGLEPEDGAEIRAANEIVSFSMTFNGVPMNFFDLSMVTEVFPRTTIKLTRQGKIVASDAPDNQLPIRLPGLDVKRFPDITYVPIQFQEDGAKIGDEWQYKKPFGESDMHYTCRLIELKDGIAKVAVSIKQEYELLEDIALEIVTKEIDAEARVKTVLTGEGYVLFDSQKGYVTEGLMVNLAVSDVTNLHDGTEKKRELKTTFSLKLRKPGERGIVVENDKAWYEKTWDAVKTGSTKAVSTATNLWATFKLAFQLVIRRFAITGG